MPLDSLTLPLAILLSISLCYQLLKLQVQHLSVPDIPPPSAPVGLTENMTSSDTTVEQSYWSSIPRFELLVRLRESRVAGAKVSHVINSYQDVLVKSMRQFVVPEIAGRLVVILDEERGRELGGRLSGKWPFPRVQYGDRGDTRVYANHPQMRAQWDLFHADLFSSAPYVGILEPNNVFVTVMTPEIIFRGGKPVIVAIAGPPAPNPCFPAITEIFLRRKMAVQCSVSAPFFVKTSHTRELRDVLASEQNSNFKEIFRTSNEKVKSRLQCNSNNWGVSFIEIMCNYLWYFHRSEYSWHIQVLERKRQLFSSGFVPKDYYGVKVTADMRLPAPRAATLPAVGKNTGIADIEKEGMCFVGGFSKCSIKCQAWKSKHISPSMFTSTGYASWFASHESDCLLQQSEHRKNVEKMMRFYRSKSASPILNKCI